MAKAKTASVSTRIVKVKKKNKGVHRKSKTSKNKSAKNYKKINVGQGK